MSASTDFFLHLSSVLQTKVNTFYIYFIYHADVVRLCVLIVATKQLGTSTLPSHSGYLEVKLLELGCQVTWQCIILSSCLNLSHSHTLLLDIEEDHLLCVRFNYYCNYAYWDRMMHSDYHSIVIIIELDWHIMTMLFVTNFIWPYLHQIFNDSHSLNGTWKPLKRPFNQY